MPGRPYLIVIEGISAAGKHTQATLLQKTLVTEGYDAHLVSFPLYGETTGAALKLVLKSRHPFSAREISMLFAVDRFSAKKLLKHINPKKQRVMILDRYTTSAAAIQSVQMRREGASASEVKEFTRWLENLEYAVFKVPREDQVLFLDVPPRETLKLLKARERRDVHNRALDNFEKDLTMQEEIYATLQHFSQTKRHWKRIACMRHGVLRSAQEIAKLVRRAVTL